MNATANPDVLVEIIPDHLLELWRKGPLMLATRANLPIVELNNRNLTLRWGIDVLTADVNDCHFRVGRPWKMKHNSRAARPSVPFGDHDLILIDFPPLSRGFFTGKVHSYNTAPVGYTEETLRAWKHALAPLIGEPCGEPKPPITSFLSS